MATLQLLENLLELPLFQGMSRNDLNEVISHTKFSFLKYRKNKIVAKEGDLCGSLLFLLCGCLNTVSKADDNGYTITEQMSAPDILQPERFFGLTQRFTRTFTTVTECNFISLDKTETMHLSEQYGIFRLNLLNMVCTKTQKTARLPWRTQPQDIRLKIARFVEARSIRPAGQKIIRIKMDRLAREINESRLNVSRELNDMDKEGLIRLCRGEFHIPALEKLLNEGVSKRK